MTPSAKKGNDPERWEKLLTALDEKLQLGLLDNVKKIASYHFEDDILYIQPETEEAQEYLTREVVRQQLELLAQDAVKIEKVKIKAIE